MIIDRISGNLVNDIILGDGLPSNSRDGFSEIVSSYKIKRKNIKRFANLVEDYNPIHRKRKKAREFGLEDTPDLGTHLAALFEQHTKRIIDGYGIDLRASAHSISFKGFVYPREIISLGADDKVNKKGNDFDFKIFGKNQDGEIVTTDSVKLRDSFPEVKEITKYQNTKSIEITPKTLKRFYRCLDEKISEEIPMMYVAAFIPSTIFGMFKEGIRGLYNRVDLEFYKQPKFGLVTTFVDSIKRREIKGAEYGFVYKFEVGCKQDGKSLLHGFATCSSNEDFLKSP